MNLLLLGLGLGILLTAITVRLALRRDDEVNPRLHPYFDHLSPDGGRRGD